MPSPFNNTIDDVIALLTTAAATELGIAESEVAIQSLNFNADERVAIIYEPRSTPFSPFETESEPSLSVGTIEVGVYTRAVDADLNSDATNNRLLAIKEINDLSFAFAQAIKAYRYELKRNSALARIFREPSYDGTIDANQGWSPPLAGTTLRHRVGQLIFQIPYCFD